MTGRARKSAGHSRSGYTLIEILVAAAFFALMTVKGVIVLRSASDVASDGAGSMILEDKARELVDRIGMAIRGSERESLLPASETPEHATALRYQLSLGMEDGEVVWDTPEEIGMDLEGNEIYWKENVGLADERRMVWSNLVRSALEGELFNDVDDNGNGLVDEEGLTFVIQGDSVTIRLSIVREDANGDPVIRTVESIVTCRN